MIPASQAFHEAAKAGAKQRTLLHFTDSDKWFTAFDYGLDAFTYEDPFNTEEDPAIGLTSAAHVAFTLFNDDGELDNFPFGWFRVYRGVNTQSFSYAVKGNAAIDFNGVRLYGYDTAPYLRTADDQAFPVQPGFAVQGFVGIDSVLYCIGSNRRAFKIDMAGVQWDDLSDETWQDQTANAWDDYLGQIDTDTITIDDEVIRKQVSRFLKERMSVSLTTTETGLTSYIYNEGKGLEFQYIPKGRFYADRPARVFTKEISIEGYDAMYASMETLCDLQIEYPITIQNLLAAICTRKGITCKNQSLLNGSKLVYAGDLSETLPELTYRELIGYIAEASGTNAIFDYDGELLFRWFETIDAELSSSDFSEFVPMEYKVKRVTRVQIRNGQSEVTGLAGTGTNDYIIQDNPLLVFDLAADGDACAQSLLDVLYALEAYSPSGINSWFADPSIQAGDIIRVSYKGRQYAVPLFYLNQTWTTITHVTAESTGNPTREVIEMTKRANFLLEKQVRQVQSDIDSITETSIFQEAVKSLTATVLGASGGVVRLLDTSVPPDGIPDTLYIADDPDPAQARKVWRFNYEGWAASENGYNGPFVVGATVGGGIIASFITAGTIAAERIGVINHTTTIQKTSTSTTLETYVAEGGGTTLSNWLTGTYNPDKSDLQGQIDGKAETWYQSTDPSSAWTTTELKAKHVKDLWYDTSTNTTKVYIQSGSTYVWVVETIPDDVFDKIDGKAQVFTDTPDGPYNVNDIWFDASSGVIKVCMQSRTASGYSASDWVKKEDYTDPVSMAYKRNLAIGSLEEISFEGAVLTPTGKTFTFDPNALLYCKNGTVPILFSFKYKTSYTSGSKSVILTVVLENSSDTITVTKTISLAASSSSYSTATATLTATDMENLQSLVSFSFARSSSATGNIDIKEVKAEVGVNTPTAWCAALVDEITVKNDLDVQFNTLEDRITAEVTDSETRLDGRIEVNKSSLESLSNEINTKVSKTTYEQEMNGKADTSWVTTTLQSERVQTNSAITNIFTQSKTYTDSAVSDYSQLKEDVYSWQTFSSTGLTLGRSDSKFTAVLTNQKLAFMEDTREVAYISNNALNITNARIEQTLAIGKESVGWFDWNMGSDGMTLKWREA